MLNEDKVTYKLKLSSISESQSKEMEAYEVEDDSEKILEINDTLAAIPKRKHSNSNISTLSKLNEKKCLII